MPPLTKTHRSRHLRSRPTLAEARLWQALRRKDLRGWKFRRQHPVAGYVVDFACPAAALVIEIDGGQHTWRRQQDVERTAEIERTGYRVIRFWNNEVLKNLDGVLQVIVAAVDARR